MSLSYLSLVEKENGSSTGIFYVLGNFDMTADFRSRLKAALVTNEGFRSLCEGIHAKFHEQEGDEDNDSKHDDVQRDKLSEQKASLTFVTVFILRLSPYH